MHADEAHTRDAHEHPLLLQCHTHTHTDTPFLPTTPSLPSSYPIFSPLLCSASIHTHTHTHRHRQSTPPHTRAAVVDRRLVCLYIRLDIDTHTHEHTHIVLFISLLANPLQALTTFPHTHTPLLSTNTHTHTQPSQSNHGTAKGCL